MASVVSSRLDYINKHQDYRSSFEEMEHELDYLKKREQVSTGVAIVCTIVAMIALAGVLGAGHIVFGALVAVALIAAVYAYWCRQAESALRAKQMTWMNQNTPTPPAPLQLP